MFHWSKAPRVLEGGTPSKTPAHPTAPPPQAIRLHHCLAHQLGVTTTHPSAHRSSPSALLAWTPPHSHVEGRSPERPEQVYGLVLPVYAASWAAPILGAQDILLVGLLFLYPPPPPFVLPHPREDGPPPPPGGWSPSDGPPPPPGEPHYHHTRAFVGTEIAAENKRMQHKIRSKGCQCTETYSLTNSV